METLEELKHRIESTTVLQSIVKTMKTLASAKIRQYERAVESLGDYNRTVEMALRGLFLNQPYVSAADAGPESPTKIGAIVFGSDQGMCGPLNSQIVSYALNEMARFSQVEPRNRFIMVVGERPRDGLEGMGQSVDESISVPGSVSGITPLVQDILVKIETWHEKKGLNTVLLFYNKYISGASYRPKTVNLLPVDRKWISNLRKKRWPNRCLPMFTMDWESLFSALIRQYIFVSLFRAFAESLASENASRLASMQGAEKNVRDRLRELSERYHQQRQMSITEEILDIVSGFEALETNDN